MGARLVRGVGVAGLVAAVAVGCAPEEAESVDRPAPGLSVKPGTVLAPLAASDGAIVTADALLFPKNAESTAWAATLTRGKILAGDRGGESNPHGFLRKVKSVEFNDMIVVNTERAGLADAFEGRIKFGRGKSIFGAKQGGTQIRKVATSKGSDQKTEKSQVDMSGSSSAEGLTFSLKESKVEVSGGFNGDLDVAVQSNGLKVWDVKVDVDAFAELYMKFDASVKVELAASASANKEIAISLEKPPEIFVTSPIPTTISLTPSAKCSIDAKGETSTSAVLFFAGDLVAGFDYDGSFKPRGEASFTAGTRDEKASGAIGITGRCTVEVTLSLLAFDAVGIDGTVGAEANLEAKACAAANTQGGNAAASVGGDYRIYGRVDTKVQIPVVNTEIVEQQLLGKDFASGKFGKGAAAGTQTDGGLVETECVPLTE